MSEQPRPAPPNAPRLSARVYAWFVIAQVLSAIVMIVVAVNASGPRRALAAMAAFGVLSVTAFLEALRRTGGLRVERRAR